MRINKQKFSFIICTTDDFYLNECCMYINQLNVPQGFSVEIIPVRDAKSMAAGYNQGMSASDAKYKVYLHQDVTIMNPNFLNDVLTVFKQDYRIGMIGMIGSPVLSSCGVMWYGERVGNLYEIDRNNVDFNGYEYRKEDGMTDVEAVDGLLMVTKEDLPWREDMFDGWDFYDVSQSFEFRKKGYRVVVPEQKKPWCAHDDGTMNLWSYDRYRRIFLAEYASMIHTYRTS